MKISNKSIRFVLVASAVSIGLAGCSMRTEDHFSKNTIQIQEDKVVEDIALSDFSPSVIEGLAHHYARHGDGGMNLSLTYNPKSKTMSAMHASDKLADLVEAFRAAGVHDLQTNLLPVMGSDSSRVVVSYLSYNALAPKDCDLMPGMEGREVNIGDDYKYGCTVDTLFAKQIARPKDLKGQETSSVSDGRRAANKVEAYRTGVDNAPLEGERASGD